MKISKLSAIPLIRRHFTNVASCAEMIGRLRMQINYMPDKSHLIIIFVNTQGQIVVRVLTRKKLIFHFEIKSPTLQNYKVSKYKFAPALAFLSSGILRFSLAKRSRLTSLQPIRIRAANAIVALLFLVWPSRRRVLQGTVCHLAEGIENNEGK